MPDFPPLSVANNEASVSVSLVDRKGDTATIRLPNLEGVSDFSVIRSAIGNLSNAGVYSVNGSAKSSIPASFALTFDESENSVETKAIMRFDAPNGDSVQIAIPAPDASIFLPDMYTVDPANTSVLALVSAVQALIGAEYVFVRGYFQTRSRGRRPVYTQPTLDEPDDVAGELPSGDPAP